MQFCLHFLLKILKEFEILRAIRATPKGKEVGVQSTVHTSFTEKQFHTKNKLCMACTFQS